jgi:hypothetical protein
MFCANSHLAPTELSFGLLRLSYKHPAPTELSLNGIDEVRLPGIFIHYKALHRLTGLAATVKSSPFAS